jgi:type III restriction enzyme
MAAISIKKMEKGGLNLSPKVTNGLIVGVEIDDYDNFTNELLNEGSSYDQEMSEYDLERLYNLICFKAISKQTDEGKKFAPERSWGKLKTALNVWLIRRTGQPRQNIYRVIVNDLLSPNSVLAPIIGSALAAYRPIREHEVNKRSERSRRTEVIEIPNASLFYTDQYKAMKTNRCAMEPFYIEKEYQGEGNETAFIDFIDNHKRIEWWYKNGDSGSEFFSIPYFNPEENKEKLFYPDWIIKAKDGIWIIETKAGMTAELVDTKYKAEALQTWLKVHKGFKGGIAVQDAPNGWKLNDNAIYSYTLAFKGWEDLNGVI